MKKIVFLLLSCAPCYALRIDDFSPAMRDTLLFHLGTMITCAQDQVSDENGLFAIYQHFYRIVQSCDPAQFKQDNQEAFAYARQFCADLEKHAAFQEAWNRAIALMQEAGAALNYAKRVVGGGAVREMLAHESPDIKLAQPGETFLGCNAQLHGEQNERLILALLLVLLENQLRSDECVADAFMSQTAKVAAQKKEKRLP